jgi:predicted ATPase
MRNMKRYVLTGAPGAGKTSVLGALRERGFAVVAEAATDVISRQQARGVAEPWLQDDFIDLIVALQRDRLGPASADVRGAARAQATEAHPPELHPAQLHLAELHDRSVLCTLALARFQERPETPLLAAEVARVVAAGLYERAVFFVRPLGFIVPTAARRISYRESLAFERLHEAAYLEHCFQLIEVGAAAVAERAALIADEIAARGLIRTTQAPG